MREDRSHIFAWAANTTPLSSTTQFANVLPGFLGQAPNGSGVTAGRTIASNMLYLLTGSVSTASTNYWINSAADASSGIWQDIESTGKKIRSQVANDYALFMARPRWEKRSVVAARATCRTERVGRRMPALPDFRCPTSCVSFRIFAAVNVIVQTCASRTPTR